MIKIWGKVFNKDRVAKHITIEVDAHATTFFDMLRTISEKLDIPTSVLLEKHVIDFNQFNFCVFMPTDYIQPVNFSRFILENVTNRE